MTTPRSKVSAPPPPRRVAIAVALMVAAATGALATSQVHRRHLVIQAGAELARQGARLRELEEDNRRLRLERAMLRHPDRIERFAENMGLVRPDPGEIRIVRARTVTTLADAKPRAPSLPDPTR